MFPNNKKYGHRVVVSFCLCLGVITTPFITNAQVVQNDAQYRAVLFELIEALQAQIALLQQQLDEPKKEQTKTDQVTVERPSTVFDGVPVLARYIVTKESNVKNITNIEHRQFLKRIYEIFPDTYDAQLREFMVFKDRKGDFGAFVETIPPEHTSWSFAINADLLGTQESESSTELIVHELAHIISYESIVGVPLPESASCHEYFTIRGCPKENSYLAVFADAFWSDSDLTRALELSEDLDAIDKADEYFESNEEYFVSGYAALSPEEDFAESFARYVTDREPRAKTIASEKVWWFDQFTDLQDVRKYIE